MTELVTSDQVRSLRIKAFGMDLETTLSNDALWGNIGADLTPHTYRVVHLRDL